MLTLPPLDQDDYEVVIPLGLLSPPQHTVPTEHIFFHLKGENKSSPANPFTNPPGVAEVRAPGNVRVLEINYTAGLPGNELPYTDYDVLFAPCRDQIYKLMHLTTLNQELTELLQATEPFKCNDYESRGGPVRYCEAFATMDVSVGTVLGTTGGTIIAALDMEAYDLRTPPVAYANPSRYYSELGRRLHIMCPFDGFTAEARAEQLSRVGDYNGQPRTAEPVCGEVMQDVPVTAQGNWYTNLKPGQHVDFNK